MSKLGAAILFLFMLFALNNIFAVSIDSSRVEVRKLPDDSIKVEKLSEIAYKYLRFQVDTAYNLAKDALSLSNKLNYTSGIANASKQLGLVFKYKTEYDSALYYYNKALKIYIDLKQEKELAILFNRMANVYKRNGHFEKSLESFQKALSISLSNKDTSLISAIYNNIGVLYQDMRLYDKALEYHLLNLSIKEQHGTTEYIATVLMNIGLIYSDKKQNEEALEYYRRSLDYLENSDYKYDLYKLVHNMGLVYENMGRYKEALEYYNKAITLEKELKDKEMLVYSTQGVGNVLIKTGNIKEGIKYLEKAFQLAEETGDLRKIYQLSANLYSSYEKIGDYKNGFQYLKKSVAIENSMYNQEKKTEILKLEQKYEAEKREQQIAFLEKEKEIQKLDLDKKNIEAKQKSMQRNVLLLVSLLTLAFLIYFLRDNKKRKKINQLLSKQNKKIIEQRTEIVKQNDALLESNKTKDKLFQIIAHDLRSPLVSIDSIMQLIPYWVEEQDYESLQKISGTLEISVKNVLALIDNLLNWALSQQGKFPYAPENISLKPALTEAIEVYQPIAEIKNIDLKFRCNKNVMVFADRNMLFTIIRNLLNNAVKFTPEKGEIEVGIDSKSRFAKIWVKDSGVGIAAEKKDLVFELASANGKGTKGETGKGLGLFFCKEFVTINNGDIFIESDVKKGTKITFTLPLYNLSDN